MGENAQRDANTARWL